MALTSIPNWTSRALQGLAYWLGYQDAYGIGERLSEGAIATEFLRLMVAHKDPGRVLEPEVMYRHIPEFTKKPSLRNSRIRADLVVANEARRSRYTAFPQGSIEAVIEVKHGRSQKAKVLEDIDMLGDHLKFAKWSIRGFLLYASVSKMPFFVDEDGGGRKTKIEHTEKGTRYKVRRVCRAISRISNSTAGPRGNYALIVEVLE